MKNKFRFVIPIIGMMVAMMGAILFLGSYVTTQLVLHTWPVGFIGFVGYRIFRKKGQLFINIIGIFLGLIMLIMNLRNPSEFLVPSIGMIFMYLGAILIFSKNKQVEDNIQLDRAEAKLENRTKIEVDTNKNFDEEWINVTKSSNWNFDDELNDNKNSEPYVNKPVKEKVKYKKAKSWTNNEVGEKLDDEPIFKTDSINFSNDKKVENKGFGYETRDVIDKTTFFSSSKSIIKSDSFSGGKIDSIFSDTWVDLSRVNPRAQDIKLDVNVLFASLHIRVPDNWIIQMDGSTIFGDSRLPKTEAVNPRHRLLINNGVAFGELKIDYKEREK